MGVSMVEIEKKAPHLVNLVKEVNVSLKKSNFDPEANKAAVVATIDESGSTRDLFSSGEIQRVADLAFAAGLVFDDDGEVPVSYFDNSVHDLGSINLSNCKGFIANNRPHFGSTDYVGALEWIIDQAGYSDVKLTSSKMSGLFRKSGTDPLSVKATAPYPTFAIFITDGEPNRGTEDAIYALLTQMSQLPIFVQFLGVGSWGFQFLRSLDDLSGRLIDNAGFFDAKDASNTEEMLAGLLNEFPEYYQKARAEGLIV